jgi:acetylornithine/succinyldiaminopimelate/putrescine aminotransferase
MSATAEGRSLDSALQVRSDAATEMFGRFSAFADTSLKVIEQNIRQRVPAISMAGWLGTGHGAKLGYLIGRIVNHTSGNTEKRYTLPANSALEAMYAVIRMCRQVAKERGRGHARRVLIFDEAQQYTRFFDPLRNGPQQALCPQVYFAESESTFRQLLDAHRDDWACTIHVAYPGQTIAAQTREAIDGLSRDTGALNVLCNSERDLSDAELFRVPENTHILILGENLTRNEVPFAAFCVVASVYSVWGTRRSLSAYTSTFAGNATSLAAALEAIGKYTSYINDVDRQVFAQIDNSFDERIRYFCNHVHPAFGELFQAEKKDLNIARAEGSSLFLANGKEVLDTSSLGCSLRGHNPDDVIPEALRQYDSRVDYFDRIENRLRELSAFSHVFPSVSGAGAVDNAIILSLLAQPGRSKIICFTGNYAGKTLVSVNFSKTAPLLADFDLPAFEPYFDNVVHIDPFKEDAEERFAEAAAGGDVALVWFELIQGYMFKRLPLSLVKYVEKRKQALGYLIGVDEVLTGMWKNGRTILYHQEYLSKVDVATMSKATSDMIFPVSWALVTEEVFGKANATDPSVVALLKRFYRNNVGGLIANHALEIGAAFFAKNDLTVILPDLYREIRHIVATSSLFSGISVEGSLIRFHLDKEWFPYEEGSIQATLVEGAASKLLLNATGILLTNLRMFLPCIHDVELHRNIVRRLKAGVHKVTASTVLAYMLCQNHEMLEALGMKQHFKEIILGATATA